MNLSLTSTIHNRLVSLSPTSTSILVISRKGAPLIAVVACLGLAVDLQNCAHELQAIEQMNGNSPDKGLAAVRAYITGKMDYLRTSRPTAVNLSNAMDELDELLKQECHKDDHNEASQSPRERLVKIVSDYAEFALDRDRQDNAKIGKYGADELIKTLLTKANNNNQEKKKLTIMTICNTGSLATAGYGTALGVVRALQERDVLEKVIALETRPYNQGSRLTAFEIVQDQLNGGTLICDNMAAAYMKEHEVDACIVGADRICANGDTANKIGTYMLAVLCAAHNIPCYTAAPSTTLDVNLPSGDHVVIEERPAEELISTSRAPKEIPVWNPAFDVTPARYLSGIMTERGVIHPNEQGFIDVAAFVEGGNGAANGASKHNRRASYIPVDYTEYSAESLPGYLAAKAPVAMKRLGTTSPDDLSCVEMGDGNLNLVFIVRNKNHPADDHSHTVIVKQSLPYVRCVGESWPLTLERAYFEYRALSAQKDACPEFVPTVYFFSRHNGLIVMEYIPPPNIILRKGLIQGIMYPTMAKDMGIFCANTLFKTSGFKFDSFELRHRVEFWSKNTEMCHLTEQVVFSEPYKTHSNNRWTSPQLDEDKKIIEEDVELKVAAARWKHKFVTDTTALIHGDLHSGSVMGSPAPHQTFVIDPEFAFYGPMGFDLGAFVGNLLLNYVSQSGHQNSDDYAEWVLEQIKVFWITFQEEFLKLWSDPKEHTGYLYCPDTLDAAEFKVYQQSFMSQLLSDTLGFAGMKMLRRIVGIAHVEDLESISDADVRAQCERRGLAIAKTFIKSSSSFESIDKVIQLARDCTP